MWTQRLVRSFFISSMQEPECEPWYFTLLPKRRTLSDIQLPFNPLEWSKTKQCYHAFKYEKIRGTHTIKQQNPICCKVSFFPTKLLKSLFVFKWLPPVKYNLWPLCVCCLFFKAQTQSSIKNINSIKLIFSKARICFYEQA